ncbi:hypothetical protein [Bradyrhizobium jicamae]|uniref:hypothetical protein n=1 Tax=Bradyrhizobium jicamae TaxID=280332 RepID=UPI0020116F84|nr:hypothetical protein [Bradyrhizobium jicamae]
MRIKACCLNSLTVAWGYCLAFVGVVMQGIDAIADVLGDATFKDQLAAAIGDARTVGRILLVVSIVTIIARVRSIRKAA